MSQRNIDELGSCLYFIKLNLSEEKFAAQFLAQLFIFRSATLSHIKAQVTIYWGEWLSVNVHLMITILPAADTTNRCLQRALGEVSVDFLTVANILNTDSLFILKIKKKLPEIHCGYLHVRSTKCCKIRPQIWSPMTNYKAADQSNAPVLWHSGEPQRAGDVKGERLGKCCSNNVNEQDRWWTPAESRGCCYILSFSYLPVMVISHWSESGPAPNCPVTR